MQGRIKLHRKAQSNPISTNLELRGLFTYFLTKANHAEGSFFHGQQKIDLLPGQFIRSMQGIADHFSISKPKAYRLTELLEKSEIVKRQGYSKYTLFTVVNRGLYQSEGNATVTRSETPPYTNKNDKNEKKGKEKKIFLPPSLQEVINYFSANGYTTETAERAYRGYDVADRHDSTGKKVINWKQKMNNVRFKPENTKKYTKTEYLQIEAERERDKVGATAKYGDAIIKKAISVYNENN